MHNSKIIIIFVPEFKNLKIMKLYINTNPLWNEMSAIANEALSEIENALEESGKESIPTIYGTLYYDNKEEELYIRDKNGAETPLREYNTHDILNVADELNEYFNNEN